MGWVRMCDDVIATLTSTGRAMFEANEMAMRRQEAEVQSALSGMGQVLLGSGHAFGRDMAARCRDLSARIKKAVVLQDVEDLDTAIEEIERLRDLWTQLELTRRASSQAQAA